MMKVYFLMKDDHWKKMTVDGRWPSMEDDLSAAASVPFLTVGEKKREYQEIYPHFCRGKNNYLKNRNSPQIICGKIKLWRLGVNHIYFHVRGKWKIYVALRGRRHNANKNKFGKNTQLGLIYSIIPSMRTSIIAARGPRNGQRVSGKGSTLRFLGAPVNFLFLIQALLLWEK